MGTRSIEFLISKLEIYNTICQQQDLLARIWVIPYIELYRFQNTDSIKSVNTCDARLVILNSIFIDEASTTI